MGEEELLLGVDDIGVDSESDRKQFELKQEEARLLQNEKDVIPVQTTTDTRDATNKSFAATMVEDYILPTKTAALENKDEFWDIWKGRYIKQYDGDEEKAKTQADNVYELISKQYENLAYKEQELTVLENMSYMVGDMENVNYIGEDYSLNINVAEQTLNGRMFILDKLTDPTRDARGVALESKKVVDFEGNIIEFSDDPYELAHDDRFVNKNGNTIKTFAYQEVDGLERTRDANLVAIYEGEDIGNREIVSRLDAYDTFLRSNTLDISTWRVAVGSVTDFVLDVADTVLAMSQYQALFASMGMSADTPVDGFFNATRDYLKTWNMSKSAYDKENTITLNNAVNLGINIGLQLLLGKGIATAGSKVLGLGARAATKMAAKEATIKGLTSKLVSSISKAEKVSITSKISTAEKELGALVKHYNKKSNLVKRFSLMSMGAMQAKATADEARQLGFTPFESAAIFFASLATMSWVNKISDLGFERLGLNYAQKIIKESSKDALRGFSPKVNTLTNIYNKLGTISGSTVSKFRTAMTKANPIVSNTLQEMAEENGEFVLDQVVRHLSNAYSDIGYKTTKKPKFMSISDDGYFDMVMTESVMNTIGGAFGGAMSGTASFLKHGMPKGVKEEELLQKGETAENFKKVGYYATRTVDGERSYKEAHKQLDKLQKTGYFGRADISTKWDKENKRYKRTKELSEQDTKDGHMSQSEFHYKATKSQLEYYKFIYSNTNKKLSELAADDQDFGFLLNSNTLFEESKNLFSKKAEIYGKMEIPQNIDLDKDLTALSKEKEKIRVDKGKVIKDDSYQEKSSRLANVLGITTEELDEIIDINEAIEKIGNGKSAQEMFLKHVFGTGKFTNLNYDLFKKLITSDSKAQLEFKETNKDALKYQDEVSKSILDHITSNGGRLSNEMIVELITKSSDILLTADARVELLNAIDKIGNGITAKKIILNTNLLNNNLELLEGLNSDELSNDLDTSTLPEGGLDTASIIKDLKQIIETNPDNIGNALRAHAKGDSSLSALLQLKYKISNGELKTRIKKLNSEGNKSKYLEALYLISKLVQVSELTEDTQLELVKFNTDAIYTAGFKLNSWLLFPGPLVNNVVESTFVDNEASGAEKLVNLILTEEDKKNNKSYKEILDPEYTLKEELRGKIANVTTVTKKNVRADLLQGFTVNETGEIAISNESLKSQLDALINSDATIKDKDGKIQFFSGVDSAKEILDQINTRLDENMFLIQAMGMLHKLENIHKTKLNNANTAETFLTNYLNSYLSEFKSFKDSPEEINNILQNNIISLLTLKESTSELLKKAMSADSDLTEVYVGDAVSSLYSGIMDINSIVINMNGDEFKSYEGELNLIKEEIAKIDPENKDIDAIGALAEVSFKIKNILNSLYNKERSAGNTDTFLNKISELKNVNNKKEFRTFLMFMMSPAAEINNLVKKEHVRMKEAISKDIDILKAKLISMPQLKWVEEIATIATDSNYLKVLNSLEGIAKNIAVFSGIGGSGKTRVVLGYAVNIVNKVLNKSLTKENILSAVLAANKPGQVQTLGKVAKEFGVSTTTFLENNSTNITQDELYALFKNNDISDINDKLRKTSIIFYDEVSHLEYIQIPKDGDESGVLNTILEKLDSVNTMRETEGLPALIMIGIGDAKQPGYIRGAKSARLPVGSKNNTDETVEESVFSATNKIYNSNTELTRNFRSKIRGADSKISEMTETLTNIVINTKGETSKITLPTFKYEVDNGVHRGVRFRSGSSESDFKTMLNDEVLVRDIETQIEATKDDSDDTKFKVLIISGLDKFNDSDIEGTKMHELYLKNKSSFTTSSFYDVQGDEANYTLMNIDPLFFKGVTQKDIEKGNLGVLRVHFIDRLKRLTMGMGRAYTYTDIAFSPAIDLKSVEDKVEMDNVKETSAFKQQWLDILLDKVLQGSEVSIETPPIVIPTNQNEKTNKVPLGLTSNKIQFGELVLPDDGTTYNSQTINFKQVLDDIETEINELLSDIGENAIEIVTEDSIALKVMDIQKKLKLRNNLDTLEIDKHKKTISYLINILDVYYNNSTYDSIEEELGGELDSENSVVGKESDADYMREVEKEKGKIVMYSGMSSNKKRSNNKKIYNDIIKYLYSIENGYSNHKTNTLTYTENGDIIVNEEDYDYFVVSYVSTKYNDKEHHLIIAKDKDTGNNPFIVAKGLTSGSYASDSLAKDFFQKRIIQIENNVGDIKENGDILYLESKITSPKKLMVGLTVGSVMESSFDIKESMLNLDTFNGSDIKKLKNGRPTINSVRNTEHVKNVSELKRKKWELKVINSSIKLARNSFPFKFYTKDKFVLNTTDGLVIIVPTSKGDIPFIKIPGGSWTPVLGILNKSIVHDKNVLKESSKYYDAEISEISKKLRGIKFDEDAHLEKNNTLERVAKSLDSISNIEETISEETARIKLLKIYRTKINSYLGNHDITIKEAEDLWNETGPPASASSIYNINRGEYAGYSVIFYTFRDDIDLGRMTKEEFDEFYAKTLKYKNSNKSALSDNRSGIGMVLLNSEGKSFEEFVDGVLKTTSATFNKTVISGKAEKSLLGLFSSIYKKINKIPNSIAEQLYLNFDGSGFDAYVDSWVESDSYKANETQLKVIFSSMFSKQNTGSIGVTTNISEDVTTLFEQIQIFEDNSQDGDDLKNSIEKYLNSNTDKDFGPFSNMEIEELLKFKLDPASLENSGGFLVLNKRKKIVLHKNAATVITAVDEDWVNKITSNKDVIPDPHIDLHRFVMILKDLNEDTIFNGVKIAMSEIISSTPDFANGLIMSPESDVTSSYLSEVSNSNGWNTLRTTVKQFRTPAVVINVNKLNDSVESYEEIEESKVSEDVALEIETLKRNYKTLNLPSIQTEYERILKTTYSEDIKVELINILSNLFIKGRSVDEKTLLTTLTDEGFEHYVLTSEDSKDTITGLNSLFSILPNTSNNTSDIWDIAINNIESKNILNKSQLNTVKHIIEVLKNKASNITIETSNENLLNLSAQEMSHIPLTMQNLQILSSNILALDADIADYPLMHDLNAIHKLALIKIKGKDLISNDVEKIKDWIDIVLNISKASTTSTDAFNPNNLLSNTAVSINAALISNPVSEEFENLLLSIRNIIESVHDSDEVLDYLDFKLIELNNSYSIGMPLAKILGVAIKENIKKAEILVVDNLIDYYKESNKALKIKVSPDTLNTLSTAITELISEGTLEVNDILTLSNNDVDGINSTDYDNIAIIAITEIFEKIKDETTQGEVIDFFDSIKENETVKCIVK